MIEIIKPDTNFPFMKYARPAAIASACAVAVSLLLAVYPGPNYGIDFKGGTEIQFRLSKPMEMGRIRAAIAKSGFKASDLVGVGGEDDRYRVRLDAVTLVTPEMAKQARKKFESAFSAEGVREFKLSPGGDKITVTFGGKVEGARVEKTAGEAGLQLRELDKELVAFDLAGGGQEDGAAAGDDVDASHQGRCMEPVCPFGRPDENTWEIFLKGVADSFMTTLAKSLGGIELQVEEIEWVGPTVGRQLRNAGIKSILYAMGLILVYVAFRFDLRFAPGAVVCLFHDVAITIGLFVILRREVNLPFIGAALTIVGYSLNDTIVVYDRIRENLSRIRERDMKLVVNKSINETLSRTILTSATTILAVLPILIGSRGTIQNFALALTIGVVVGTYSSIYIASPISVWIDSAFLAARRNRKSTSV